MKTSISFVTTLVALAAIVVPGAKADTTAPAGTEILTDGGGNTGYCYDDTGYFSWAHQQNILSATACDTLCQSVDTTNLLGFSYDDCHNTCVCHYDNNIIPVPLAGCGVFESCSNDALTLQGQGPLQSIITTTETNRRYICYRYTTSRRQLRGGATAKELPENIAPRASPAEAGQR